MLEVRSHFPVLDEKGHVLKLFSVSSGASLYVSETKGNTVGEYINKNQEYTNSNGAAKTHGVDDNTAH
jgi:hypothetical protein